MTSSNSAASAATGSGGRSRQFHHSHQQHQQVVTSLIGHWILSGSRDLVGGGSTSYDNASIDSQFTDDVEEELTVLEACIDCDDEALYDIIQNGTTWDQLNERDKSGRTGLSHACANGFMPILELLAGCDDVDPNLADNDGNTPLIFAAQAGHDDVVSFLLHHFRHVRIDQCNKLGFTALMKAAIQGRTRCAKLLLFAGANPNRRDNGRGLCAEEWARFCGCHNCADAIAKYIRSKKYFFKKTFLQLSKERWTSEPDLFAGKRSITGDCSKSRGGGGGGGSGGGGSWIQRHLSLKRKKKGGAGGKSNIDDALGSGGGISAAASNRCGGSAPLLITISPVNSPPETPIKSTFRRPSCIEGVIPTSIIPKLRVVGASSATGSEGGAGSASGSDSASKPGCSIVGPGSIPSVIYEEMASSPNGDEDDEENETATEHAAPWRPPCPPQPPQILATDFDSEMGESGRKD